MGEFLVKRAKALQAMLAVLGVLVLSGLGATTAAAQADRVTVAVAANFAAPMKAIVADFERQSGYQVSASFGATGQFYAQIRHGAPFDILLAGDSSTPTLLKQEGHAVAKTQFTYATGRLVLWSATPGLVDSQGLVLQSDRFKKIALANPKLAPYGAAAVEVIEHLGLAQALRPRFVQAANIGQAFHFVASGNADLGFVALSQVFADGKIKEGSGWLIPASYYTPIRQDAILLVGAQNNRAALAFLEYLTSDVGKQIIESFGYEVP